MFISAINDFNLKSKSCFFARSTLFALHCGGLNCLDNVRKKVQ